MAVYGPYCSTWVADDNIRTSHQITINKQKREVLIGFKSAQEEEKARNIIKINYFSKEQYMKRWDESVAEQVTQSQEYLLELNTFIHFSNFLLDQNVSNEDHDTRSFQRTRSAQYTSEQAQSLLQLTSSPKTTNFITTIDDNNDDEQYKKL
ncbi:unnamed protein product [Rotaria socialis]|uniref:Uncharacterized protein n=1 Tax=Rotaria socialis TaxID=392032 RepID=A0A820WGQ4_9BILA|nr:unnamed protein product [Rotaria socialis]